MSLLIVLAALGFLMLVAYRGYSVILFAPIAALGAVLLTDPSLVAPMFTGLFMDKMVGFLKLYFPVFLLGAVFGKLIELSGFSKSIVGAAIRLFGPQRAMLSIVLVSGLLTYGGVSLFVVVFAIMIYSMIRHRKSVGHQPANFTGPNSKLQWLWALIPAFHRLHPDGHPGGQCHNRNGGYQDPRRHGARGL